MTVVDDVTRGLPAVSDRGKTSRAYTGVVRVDPVTEAVLKTHTHATNVAIAAMTRVCLRAVAARVDHEWVNVWRRDTDRFQRRRLAAVCVLSWIAPVSHAQDCGLPLVADPEAFVATHVERLGFSADDAEAFVADAAAVFTARVRDDARWVALVAEPDVPVALVGWAETLDRMVGTPDAPAKGDIAMLVSHTWRYWMGSGEKTDPALVPPRAHAVLDALADPSCRTVGDVLFDVVDAATIDEGLAWLSDGVKGSPSAFRQLAKRSVGTVLDEVATGKKTHRDVLVDAFSKWLNAWEARAQWNTDVAAVQAVGDPTAFGQLTDALHEGMPGAGFLPKAWVELLTHAVTCVVTSRAKMFERAEQWAQADEAVQTATVAAPADALALVDGWVRAQPWWNESMPVVLGRGAAGYGDVFEAWRQASQRTVEARVAQAETLGAQWEQWWTWVAAQPDLWSTPNTFDGVWAVHQARHRAANLAAPVVTLPHPTHSPKATWHRKTLSWPGTLTVDGRLTATVWDGTTYTPIEGAWQSRRLSTILTSATDAPEVSRNDRASRLAVGLHIDSPAHVDADLGDTPFTLRAEPDGRITLTAVISHTTPRDPRSPLPADARRVMGVHLGTSVDAHWAIWDTLTPARTPAANVDTITINNRPGRRVGPPSAGPLAFAGPVADGHITLSGKSRWANQQELDAAAAILTSIPDVNHYAHRGVDVAKIRRDELVADMLAFVAAAAKANTLLARLAADNYTDPTQHPNWTRLTQLWPAVATSDLAAVWADRDKLIGTAINTCHKQLVFSGQHHLGPSLARLTEFDTLIRLIATYATRPTPRDTSPRTRPPGIASTIIDKRARTRGAWANELAARIVQTALANNVTIIAFAEDPLPAVNRARSRAFNKKLAAWARRDVLTRVEALAPLHGLRVVTVTTGPAKENPATATPMTPVIQCPLPQALAIHASPSWARAVTRANTTLAKTPDDQAAQAVINVNTHLDRAAAEKKTTPANERKQWLTQRRQQAVMLPHWAGPLLAPTTALATPAVNDTSYTWRYTSTSPRDRMTANVIAWRGHRRTIKQT